MYIIIRLYSHKVLNSQVTWVPFNLMKDSFIHIIHSFTSTEHVIFAVFTKESLYLEFI